MSFLDKPFESQIKINDVMTIETKNVNAVFLGRVGDGAENMIDKLYKAWLIYRVTDRIVKQETPKIDLHCDDPHFQLTPDKLLNLYRSLPFDNFDIPSRESIERPFFGDLKREQSVLCEQYKYNSIESIEFYFWKGIENIYHGETNSDNSIAESFSYCEKLIDDTIKSANHWVDLVKLFRDFSMLKNAVLPFDEAFSKKVCDKINVKLPSMFAFDVLSISQKLVDLLLIKGLVPGTGINAQVKNEPPVEHRIRLPSGTPEPVPTSIRNSLDSVLRLKSSKFEFTSKEKQLLSNEINRTGVNSSGETREEPFDEEVEMPAKGDKKKVNHPKYMNIVIWGYEWNRYNMSHYSVENPPPMKILGYRFNIIYPDLEDPRRTPRYFRMKGDKPDTILVKFEGGPPYTDLYFRISNKEWDLDRRSGFSALFERGVLSLYFHFKREHYRR